MGRPAAAHRTLRWLAVGTSLAGLAVSASGVVLLARGGSATEVTISSTVVSPTSTPTRSEAPPGWRSCANVSGGWRVSFPTGWATPTHGGDACRVLRPVDSGDAGTGYIVLRRVRGVSLVGLARRLARPGDGFGALTTSTVTRHGRPMLRATGSDTIRPDLPAVTMFAVKQGDGVVTVAAISAGMSTEGEDELAAIAATLRPS